MTLNLDVRLGFGASVLGLLGFRFLWGFVYRVQFTSFPEDTVNNHPPPQPQATTSEAHIVKYT